jgi:hypothetical protein
MTFFPEHPRLGGIDQGQPRRLSVRSFATVTVAEEPAMQMTSLALTLTLLAASTASLADGLSVAPNALALPRWQVRMELDSTTLRTVRPEMAPFGLGAAASQQTAMLFGDYRLDALRFGQTGGLRLTSGVVLSQRTGAYAADPDARSAWPYLGIGYSGNGERGDWGFSADIGLAAQSLGATVRLGRVFQGNSVGDALRDLRLQPVVRFGMTYSF